MPRRSKPPKWLIAAKGAGKGFTPTLKPDWVARALSRAGVLTTSEAEDAVHAGRVVLNGRVVREPLALVKPTDQLKVDGHLVDLAPKPRVLAFHKPASAVTAPKDPEGHPTVFDLFLSSLPPELGRFAWHAVGRLDRNTTGLLLFTNDERVVAHVTSPRTHLPKRYVAVVSGVVMEEKLEPLRRGIVLDDGPARPAKTERISEREVALVITEGRHHQVKRMLGAVGLPVLHLHRSAVGDVMCDVEVGTWRALTDDEIATGLGYTPQADCSLPSK